jgi:hypothetical protein
MACELLAWLQMLAFTGHARRLEPKRLRLGIFAAAGRLVLGGRRLRLRLAARWPGHHRGDHPAVRPRTRLTSPNRHRHQEGDHQSPWNNPPARRDSRATKRGQTLKNSHQPRLKPLGQDHERLRLKLKRIFTYCNCGQTARLVIWLRHKTPE